MRGLPSLVAVAVVVTAPALWPSAARAQQESPAQVILRDSDWTLLIDGVQEGGMRIRKGAIYPGNTRLTQPVGEAAFTDAGELNLRFLHHPKIAEGEALVVKVAAGRWAGPLVQSGGQRQLVLRRDR